MCLCKYRFTSKGSFASVLLWLYLETSVVVNTDHFSEAHVSNQTAIDIDISKVVVFLELADWTTGALFMNSQGIAGAFDHVNLKYVSVKGNKAHVQPNVICC